MADDDKVGRTWLDVIYGIYKKIRNLSLKKIILIAASVVVMYCTISFFLYWIAKPGEKVSFLFGLFEITKQPLPASKPVSPITNHDEGREAKISTPEKEIGKSEQKKSATIQKPEPGKSKPLKVPIPVKFQEFTVLLTNENNKIDWVLSHKIISIVKQKGFSVGTSPILTESFVKSGKYDRIFKGSPVEVTASGLAGHIGRLILGKKSASFIESSEYEGLITATVSVEIHIISAKSGTIEDSFAVTDKGAGYTKSKAEEKALENILKSLSKRLLKSI